MKKAFLLLLTFGFLRPRRSQESSMGQLLGRALGLLLLLGLLAAPAEAGITFVAAGTNAVAIATSVSPGLPAGFAANDIHVLVVTTENNDVITVPAGWTKKIELANGSTMKLTVAWRRAVAGDTAPTISMTSPSN